MRRDPKLSNDFTTWTFFPEKHFHPLRPSLLPCHCLRSGSFGLHVVPLAAWHSSPKDQDSLRTSPQRITKIDKSKTNLQMSWDRTLKPKSFHRQWKEIESMELSCAQFSQVLRCSCMWKRVIVQLGFHWCWNSFLYFPWLYSQFRPLKSWPWVHKSKKNE